LAATMGLADSQAVLLAEGLGKILRRQERVLWLQAMSCTGCSISFLNTDKPDILEVLTRFVSLVYHSNVSAAQGEQCMQTIDKLVSEGDYVLVLEGAIPLGMPESCVVGGKPITSLLPEVMRKAKAIVAAGTCSSFGGIPAAEGNLTAAAGAREFMNREQIPVEKRLINCPGCPVHPESIVTILAYLSAKGSPAVNPDLLTPNMLYSHSVHEDCPRFHYWEKEMYAEKFGDEGCLFKLGCLGPLSHTTCPRRQWNSGVNWCIRAGAPCTACTSEHFARKRSFAFYRKSEKYHSVAYAEKDRGRQV
jgi:hydrogenase small subunit